MHLIELHDLKYTPHPGLFGGGGSSRKPVLDGVSLAVDEGSSTGLLGESGSGKTTIARCIAGLLRPDSGTIVYNGRNIFPETANRDAVGTGIQMLFQSHGASLDPCMTVLDTLSEGITSRAGKSSAVAAEAGALAASVGLPADCLGMLPSRLSGGQRHLAGVRCSS